MIPRRRDWPEQHGDRHSVFPELSVWSACLLPSAAKHAFPFSLLSHSWLLHHACLFHLINCCPHPCFSHSCGCLLIPMLSHICAHTHPPFDHCSLTAGFLALAPSSVCSHSPRLCVDSLEHMHALPLTLPLPSHSHSIDPDCLLWFTLMSALPLFLTSFQSPHSLS